MYTKKELRKFGLLVGSILFIIGAIPFFKGKTFNLYVSLPAITLILLALALPGTLNPVYKVWMKVGHVLGKVNSFLILSLIYFLVLTPIGIISKIFGKNSEKFRFRPDKNSYWIKKVPVNVKENMKRLF